MKYQAIIFDLFGTLVASFTRRNNDPAYALMAAEVCIPFSEFWKLVGELADDYYLGAYGSEEDSIREVCNRFGVAADSAQIERPANYRYEFMADTLVPERNTMAALAGC